MSYVFMYGIGLQDARSGFYFPMRRPARGTAGSPAGHKQVAVV